jgi:hypothetical protein
MIKPTIGRVVWFWEHDDHVSNPDSQPRAAIVAHVHSDECVNLAVFDSNGNTSGVTSVALHQGEGPKPRPPFCEWMPYQKGQAKREAEREAQVPQQPNE